MHVYKIKDWDKHFENSESRKIKSLRWTSMPNKHDGKGYRRLVAHSKSVQLFCAWSLIIQVASKMPARGVLADEDGPLSPPDLAFMTGFPETLFEQAFAILSDPQVRICWIEKVDLQVADSQAPPESPGNLPARPEISGDAGAVGKGMVGDGRVGVGGAALKAPPASPPKQSWESVIAELSDSEAYQGINVAREAAKMAEWCKVHRKHPTKARLVNWLNRCDQPLLSGIEPRRKGPNI